MAAFRHWTMYQLDIKNAFHHGDLMEEVHMEQHPGVVAEGLVCHPQNLYMVTTLKQSLRAWVD